MLLLLLLLSTHHLVRWHHHLVWILLLLLGRRVHHLREHSLRLLSIHASWVARHHLTLHLWLLGLLEIHLLLLHEVVVLLLLLLLRVVITLRSSILLVMLLHWLVELWLMLVNWNACRVHGNCTSMTSSAATHTAIVKSFVERLLLMLASLMM